MQVETHAASFVDVAERCAAPSVYLFSHLSRSVSVETLIENHEFDVDRAICVMAQVDDRDLEVRFP